MDKYLERELIKIEDMIGFHASRIISCPLVPPEHVYFSLTNRCCLRCIMCDIPKSPGRQEDELNTEEVKKIILQIKDLGVRHLIFSGGEPLLRSDLVELVRFSRASGIAWVDIITNGILCNDDVVQGLIQAGLNHVTVSLDGVSEVHDSIRGAGSFQKSAQAIDLFNYYKQKLNTVSPSVGINFTILDKNINDMLKVVEFAKEKKCNAIVFQPVLVSNVSMDERQRNSLWPSESGLSDLEENIRRLLVIKAKEKDILIYTDSTILKGIPGYFKGLRPGRNFKCYEGIKRIVITCDGRVWSCKGIYGDLKNENLKQLWFSTQAKKIREDVNNCKDHCLQDCVYFPMDISGQVKSFLSGIRSSGDNALASKRIISRLDYCINQLSKRLSRNFFSNFSKEKIEIYKLNTLRNEVIKDYKPVA
ncbi:MAG: radical SAM protein [Candidatus Omnitrophica bacterium]|jgi:MoaA/NifB/PqqE/SkfB family radical SAM enzyme|nr:radical SAM protein [Candidatus Omnitrophota bacterium]